MLFRLILLLLTSIITIQAKEQKIEILAKTLNKESSIVHAKDDVVLYSDKYIITADEAYYDYNSSDLELIGDITIMEGSSFSTRSGHAKLNIKNDSGNLTPMFAYTGKSKIWLKCNETEFDEKYYITKKSILSSCDVQNPDWKIGFTTGKYDRQERFIYTYNTLFYIADIPVFYLPYFVFPTDMTRRTGLLRPEFSLGSDEGLYYRQPIYFAPKTNWDLQLDSQIRTSRGVGLHGKLRFADSPYSTGEISAGLFKEQKDYVEKNELKNDKHYGYSMMYDRSRIISGYFEDTEDGLWMDIKYLNDIDYLNTIDNKEKNYNSLVQSTFNYYLKRDLDYFGLYSKYYIDTAKDSNDATTQEIPSLHYHKFTNNIFTDNIFYSIDYQSKNYISKDGFDGIAHQVDMPISVYFPILDDFLHFKVTENFYLAKINYDGGKGYVTENFHKFSLYSELAKPYEDFFHTMYLGMDYMIPGHSKKSDGWKKMINESDDQEVKSLLLNTKKHISFDLVQFFYNSEGKNLVTHSLRQSIIMDDLSDNEYRYLDLTNNIHIHFSNNLTLKNIFNYSHEYSRLSKFQTSLVWEVENYSTSFIHTYQKDSYDDVDNYLTFSVDAHYIKNYNLFANLNYDIEDEYFKSWQIGWKMTKKCWDYRLAYREEVEPDSSSSGSTNKKGVYLTFNLYPLGGINYDFTKESTIGE